MADGGSNFSGKGKRIVSRVELSKKKRKEEQKRNEKPNK